MEEDEEEEEEMINRGQILFLFGGEIMRWVIQILAGVDGKVLKLADFGVW